MQSLKVYILFENASSAFSAQNVLSSPLLFDFDFTLQLVPTPKEYSKSCALAILLEVRESLYGESAEQFMQSIISMLAQKHIKHDIIRL
ncbi:putative Se/S carrier-like protein [uncultured Helicobacter sp.]|uniref:putative Se/S carrier-like protein n=1 Tax=uncultured Helicobacter sp. TaxID=175537 RepID=UPI0025E76CAF|nr:putative Se/S carrier-like protein [uncultured Helicobacter sp.]